METGMLWFVTEPKSTIEEQVRKAAAYFKKKYGKDANLCLVHKSMFTAEGGQLTVDNITVKPWKSVVPSHMYIGVEGDGSELKQEAVKESEPI